MRMTTRRALALVFAAALALSACAEAPDDEPEAVDEPDVDEPDVDEPDVDEPEPVDFRGCLVTDAGGVDDRSINVMPESPTDQRRLARRLGYQDSDTVKAEQALLEEVQKRTAEVRTLYERALQKLRENHSGTAY
jgi:hypothetical protein